MILDSKVKLYSLFFQRGRFTLLLLTSKYHSLKFKDDLSKDLDLIYSTPSWTLAFDALFHSRLLDPLYDQFTKLKISFDSGDGIHPAHFFTDLSLPNTNIDLIHLVYIDFILQQMSNTAIFLGTPTHTFSAKIIEDLAHKYPVILPILGIPLSRLSETCQFDQLVNLRIEFTCKKMTPLCIVLMVLVYLLVLDISSLSLSSICCE